MSEAGNGITMTEHQVHILARGIVMRARSIHDWLQQPEVAARYAAWKRQRDEKAAAAAEAQK